MAGDPIKRRRRGVFALLAGNAAPY
ncbi:hypothetical protein KL86PLE_100462 [uncultured Pleomorphomonas sp.]|uniref:Uncharacterized protein n=1 Tax=uncultured Pleomorphomonas sp. TaxID=442121 RepID=A0A212L3F9_9HYPH|nr:hypothetical protein KL86PLE_100462 [uncultured Pleomorphomonas sp.]